MKKVALVSFTSKEYNRGFLTRGLLYLGTILKDKGYNVKLFQRTLLNTSLKEFINLILDFNPEFIGVSLTESNCVRDNIWAINEIKKRKENIKIIVGGPHVTAVKGEVFEYLNCDFAFYGEAERSFLEFLEKYPECEEVKGLMYKKDGKVVINSPAEVIKNLDKLPLPDYEIIYGISTFKEELLSKKKNTLRFAVGFNYINTARGCMYNCNYCSIPFLYKNFRVRSPNVIVDEVEYNIRLFKTSYVDFGCDNFTYDKNWAKAVCKEIIRRKLKIKFIINTRIDLLDEEIIQILKKAGCCLINIGFETGSTKILKKYGKNIKKGIVLKYPSLVKMLKKNKIKLRSYIMLGSYEEGFLDIFKSVLLLIKLRSYSFIHLFDAYPGTKVYEDYVKKGVIDKYWYVKDSRCKILKNNTRYWTIRSIRTLVNFINDCAIRRYYYNYPC